MRRSPEALQSWRSTGNCRNSQETYRKAGVNAEFCTYEAVGHRSTKEINAELISFFRKQLEQDAVRGR